MKRAAIICVATALVALTTTPDCLSSAPQLIAYQGYLTDTLGEPLDTTVAMTFSIYRDPVSVSYDWIETHPSVEVVNGRYHVLLGSQYGSAPFDLEAGFFHDTLTYLGVTVGSDPELSPRTRLVAVPYAMTVGTLYGAQASTIFGSLTLASGSISCVGNLQAQGRATIGPDHTGHPGNNGFMAGAYHTCYSPTIGATISGGDSCRVQNVYPTIGGGYRNSAWESYSTVGGGYVNSVSGAYGTVAGGQNNTATSASGCTVGGGSNNQAGQPASPNATVSGGTHNRAHGTCSAISGGWYNFASGDYSSVGGGQDDTASGDWSMIPGGYKNRATGDYSWAAGRRAKADHKGNFVWADGTDHDFLSTADNEFSVRSIGGARFVSGIDGVGTPTAGVQLASGGGSWSTISDRNRKENFRDVNNQDILEKVSNIEITTWNYKTQRDEIRHIGPTAQDFYQAFQVGEDNQHITTVDIDGVSLAAIQALLERIEKLEKRIAELDDASK